jgi:hypothetical protein
MLFVKNLACLAFAALTGSTLAIPAIGSSAELTAREDAVDADTVLNALRQDEIISDGNSILNKP